MKDEIKEILNDLQRVADRKCYPEDILCGSIAQEWIDYIEDYITNLQEARNMLKESFETMTENYFEEKSRNEKAIKLLKEEGCYEEDTKIFCSDIYQKLPELLNILQGEDKDE